MEKMKYGILLLALVFVAALWISAPDEVIEAPAAGTTFLETTLPQLTKDEILNLFYGYAYADPDNKQAVDCVAVTDGAFDLMGVVQYTTEDCEGCWFDYLSRDGNIKGVMGIQDIPSEDGELTYLGDGVVSCNLLDKDGIPYTCIIHYFNDGNGNIDFSVEAQ